MSKTLLPCTEPALSHGFRNVVGMGLGDITCFGTEFAKNLPVYLHACAS